MRHHSILTLVVFLTSLSAYSEPFKSQVHGTQVREQAPVTQSCLRCDRLDPKGKDLNQDEMLYHVANLYLEAYGKQLLNEKDYFGFFKTYPEAQRVFKKIHKLKNRKDVFKSYLDKGLPNPYFQFRLGDPVFEKGKPVWDGKPASAE